MRPIILALTISATFANSYSTKCQSALDENLARQMICLDETSLQDTNRCICHYANTYYAINYAQTQLQGCTLAYNMSNAVSDSDCIHEIALFRPQGSKCLMIPTSNDTLLEQQCLCENPASKILDACTTTNPMYWKPFYSVANELQSHLCPKPSVSALGRAVRKSSASAAVATEKSVKKNLYQSSASRVDVMILGAIAAAAVFLF
ncbi:hypothetical protein HDU98_010984 [Podochytrium sp. JEL0797]|nr:hypothetical protein HDU98_010984 [Podochytrium sp. JEL0797]